ncbi:MAG: flagellin, partial [Lachnospiraceae bacterium]|nr:flagellin [Lachnospiraceae bacterium]
MKINYNMSAKITNQQLLRTEDKMTAVMERLSSGFKLNHAKDNPSGMAISNKMILQIDGLSQSSKNASNGTSVMQTADGALSEVTDLIQRMRELSVQAASDSNTPDDRKAIQKEIDSLKQEVDRVSKDTEFNTKSLLDGSLGRRVYTTNATRVSVSGDVTAGNYSVTIDKAAEQAVMQADTAVFNDMTATVGVKGKITINDSIVNIEATDTYEEVFEKIRDGGEIGETIVKLDGDKLDFTSTAYGDTGMVKIEISDPALAGALGFAATEPAIAYGSNAE